MLNIDCWGPGPWALPEEVIVNRDLEGGGTVSREAVTSFTHLLPLVQHIQIPYFLDWHMKLKYRIVSETVNKGVIAIQNTNFAA